MRDYLGGSVKGVTKVKLAIASKYGGKVKRYVEVSEVYERSLEGSTVEVVNKVPTDKYNNY